MMENSLVVVKHFSVQNLSTRQIQPNSGAEARQEREKEKKKSILLIKFRSEK
jgi:hypothetical protein